MTDKQPEALRLADAFGIPHWTGLPVALHVEAAAELRRLHEVNAELVEALREVRSDVQRIIKGQFVHLPTVDEELTIALAKAQRENNANG